MRGDSPKYMFVGLEDPRTKYRGERDVNAPEINVTPITPVPRGKHCIT